MRHGGLRGALPLAALLLVLLLDASAASGAWHAGSGVLLPASPAVRWLPRVPLRARSQPYGWPLRPFDRQHAVRGGFGDPRFGIVQRNFHFGIDLPAAGGTPVYAVAPGVAFLEQDHVDVLTQALAGDASGFSYWHIVPAVREHARIRRHELLGWVKPYWAHLHFAEIWRGNWVNPLRPGALTPYADRSRPQIGDPRHGPSGRHASHGARVDIVVPASVAPATPPSPPWQGSQLAPALLRWRLLRNGAPVSPWRIAADFRTFIPPNRLYRDVYASDTTPDARNSSGRYDFYLVRGWDIRPFERGRYAIAGQARGPRQSCGSATRTFALASLLRPVRVAS